MTPQEKDTIDKWHRYYFNTSPAYNQTAREIGGDWKNEFARLQSENQKQKESIINQRKEINRLSDKIKDQDKKILNQTAELKRLNEKIEETFDGTIKLRYPDPYDWMVGF